MAVITITSGEKRGSRELARHLGEKLNYQCISDEVVAQCAKKYNILEQDLLKQFEQPPKIWQKWVKEHGRYLVFLQCAVIDAVRQDNVVYFGNAGQLFLARVGHVLKIRLEVPFEERVDALMKESGKENEEAAASLRKMDDQEGRWVKMLYGKDWLNPSLYDLSFNLENMSVDTIGEIVALTVGRKEFKTTGKSTNQLNRLSLECEVKAAIAADDKIWDQPITVSADAGVITLTGTVKNKKIRDIIADTASQVKGVSGCRVYISLSSDPLLKRETGKY